MTDQRQDRFDDALNLWADRPPRTSPHEAARQVIAKLPEPSQSARFWGGQWRLVAAAAGLALILAFGWAVWPESPGPASTHQNLALPPLSDEVVLLWLDDKTPLYLTVALPATKGGSR